MLRIRTEYGQHAHEVRQVACMDVGEEPVCTFRTSLRAQLRIVEQVSYFTRNLPSSHTRYRSFTCECNDSYLHGTVHAVPPHLVRSDRLSSIHAFRPQSWPQHARLAPIRMMLHIFDSNTVFEYSLVLSASENHTSRCASLPGHTVL